MNISDSFFANIRSWLRQVTADEAGLTEALEDLLTALPPRQDPPGYTHLSLCSSAEDSAPAVRMLTYARFPLKFQIRSRNASPEVLLGVPPDQQQALLTMLEAGLPGLQTFPSDEDPLYRVQSFARFSCLDHDPGREVNAGWTDTISGLSLPGCWSVCLEAIPLTQNDSWTATQLRNVEALNSKLAELSQLTCTITQPISPDARNPVPKWQKPADLPQFTATASPKNPLTDRTALRAENTLHNLDTLLREGGWTVSLSLRAQTREQLEILQSLLQAAFCGWGSAIRWEEEISYTLLTCSQLACLVSFPRVCGCASQAAICALSIPSEQFRRPFGIFSTDRKYRSHILGQLLSDRKDVTFLMLDPEGSCQAPSGRIYTLRPGSENSIKINPFRFPEGGSLAWHIQGLTDLFSRVWKLDGLHRTVLEQSITRCYSDLGWNLITDTNYYSSILETRRLYPTFDTLWEELSAENSRMCQDLLLELDRYLTGTPGAVLNDSRADLFTDLLSLEESVTLDFSPLVSQQAKQVAMGALLIQLAQTPDLGDRILILQDADLLPGREPEGSGLEEALQKLTTNKAGPLFTSRCVGNLPGHLADAMDGCIVHRLSARDQSEELLRFLNPRDLQIPDTDHVLIRFGDMTQAAFLRIAPQPDRTEIIRPVGAAAADSRELVRQLLDTSGDLNQLVQERMEPLYFQILFDTDRESLTEALNENLLEPIRVALAHHTLTDMIKDTDPDTLTARLVERCFSCHIRKRVILGYCLQNLMEMYVFRILRLMIRERTLREADWKVLQDYRKHVLEPRYRDMVLRSRGNLHETVFRNAGVHTHSELLVQILVDLHRYRPNTFNREETSELIRSLAGQYLLKLPAEEWIEKGLSDPVLRCLQEE